MRAHPRYPLGRHQGVLRDAVIDMLSKEYLPGLRDRIIVRSIATRL